MTIYFQNKGLIDLDAVKTFGVSVKENKNPIGYFGTGLKYAIAVILRNGGNVVMYRGKKKYNFTVKTKKIRKEKFNIICLNDQQLGFTTELGKNWKMWMAFRELHCNTLDEDGVTTDDQLKALAGNTTIIVNKCSDFDDCYYNRNQIFLNTNPIIKSDDLNLHTGRTGKVFYRGVKVDTLNAMALFTYNLKNQITLTEDRTMRYSYQARNLIETFWAQECKNKELIKECLLANTDDYEKHLDFETEFTASPEFLQVVKEIRNSAQAFKINKSAIKLQNKLEPSTAIADVIRLNNLEQRMVDKAYSIIINLGYRNVKDYQMSVVIDLGTGIMGSADYDQIVLSHRCFTMGQRYVTSTLFEEYLHLEFKLRDCTYEMQTYLFDKIIELGELVLDDERLEVVEPVKQITLKPQIKSPGGCHYHDDEIPF